MLCRGWTRCGFSSLNGALKCISVICMTMCCVFLTNRHLLGDSVSALDLYLST
jgi:hypothetical protein